MTSSLLGILVLVRVMKKGEMTPLGAQQLGSVNVEKWVKYNNATSAKYFRRDEADSRVKNNDVIFIFTFI